MSVATASGAVSTHHHQPTQEQIRLAQLIDDKKHDQPEVQEIVRRVLDVVANSNQEDALLALFDCDYDCEKAVALLIEKGHDVANEWRTATNHKLTKKQQQKVAATKNGHGDSDENGQRGNDGFTQRGKSRGGRVRFQQNGGDSHNNNQQQNDNYIPQRGGGRGRFRGNNRGRFRGTDRNYSHQTQDSNVDISSPSDSTQRPTDVSHSNRHSRGGGSATTRQQQQEQWDVGNWNGETLIYSRTTKDDEQPDNPSEVSNGQSDLNNQQKSKPEFDPIEAARQIKNVIGIGQTPKPLISDQQEKSKVSNPLSNNKLTPPLRIPHQPVIFSDRFNGGINKIDVQFGNLGESYDDTSSQNVSKPTSSSAFHQHSHLLTKQNNPSTQTNEQSSYNSTSTRSSEQPVINQQRLLSSQVPQQQQQQQQQPSMAMKHVVTPQYAVHQQQHAPNMLLQSLLYHHQQQQQQQQQEPVTLDTSYDPTAFPLPSIDFNSPYFMAATMNQQPTQPRYLVSQPPTNRQPSSTNVQTLSTSSVPPSSTATKKAPAVPPGIFPPTGPLPTQPAYSAAYGIPPSVGGQQQPGGTTYSAPYDAEHIFTSAFMQLANAQQAQSPSATYGSVTPPVQQQQTNNNNDNKTMNYRAPPLNENLMLLQQYQQYALQQSNSQQQGQQVATHSAAPLSYFLGHPPSGPSYSPGPQIMYAQPPTAMPQQQQVPKQQYNSSSAIGGNDDYYGRTSSSSNKDAQYMYAVPTQPQQVPPQSAGQQQGVNKQQQQQRTGGNVYNNQQGQQRPFQ